MTLNSRDAFLALAAHIRSLGKPPEPFGLPDYLFVPAEPVLAYYIRKRRCYVFALAAPLEAVTGYVLDVDGNVSYEVRDGNVPGALCKVGRW